MMAERKESPSQTAGPYVHIGCTPSVAGLAGMYGGRDPGAEMIVGPVAGTPMTLSLAISDGAGERVRDALVEIWQAGPDGGFGTDGHFRNWGRRAVDAEAGEVRFETVKPGVVEGQAPHVLVWIVARGINLALVTRVYFPDESDRNATDPVLSLAGARAETMVARQVEDGYRHEIYLQGERETVFLDV